MLSLVCVMLSLSVVRRNVFAILMALATLLVGFLPRTANACGGFFCQPLQPVIQTGEQIVFSVDEQSGTIDAIINIAYSGPASEFVWMLPLQATPTAIDVGPQSMFQTINQLTTPRFNLQFETQGTCRFESDGPLNLPVRGGSPTNDEGGVRVVIRKEVGPFDTVVLESQNLEQVRQWLVDNGYGVTDEIMKQVEPYVEKGDALVALKLLKNNEAGDIQPIHITMPGTEVCVPLRLTAIAASDDMDVTVTVLSNGGRAIPKNYFEVELNLALIDWFSGGANYRSLVSAAANEAEGNAFTTEFAGSARLFDNQIYPARGYDRAALEGANNFLEFVGVLGSEGLVSKPGIGPILRRYAAEPLKSQLDRIADQFDQCVLCFSPENGEIDVTEAVSEIWDRIVLPEERMQALFDAQAYATRLYTLLSPEEMTIDPQFAFRTDLPDVTNIHVATLVTECRSFAGNESEYLRIEETGLEMDLDRLNETRAQLPASSRVRQLAENTEIEDNRPFITQMLSRNAGGGCQAVPGERFNPLGFALFFVGFFLLRSRLRALV